MSPTTASESTATCLHPQVPAHGVCAARRRTRRHRIVLSALVLLALLATAAASSAQVFDEIIEKARRTDAQHPWQIEADEVNYDDQSRSYIATGNVVITRWDIQLRADYVRFEHEKMQAYAKGNVVLSSEGDRLSGSSLEMDLDSKVGSVTEGRIFIKEENWHIEGDHIQKTGPDSYRIDRGQVTTCDGEAPAWRISGRDIEVTFEGYGFARHTVLWFKQVPVLYSPFLAFPAKRERQSGFLLPEFGTSNRWGNFYLQPFYWAISENSDATFYEHYLNRRGFKHGVEFRYVLSQDSKGAVMFDYLRDKQIDDGTEFSTRDWGYDEDQYDRTNRDRYWLRMSHHQSLPLDFYARLDLDIVSDQDYLREFREGATGFKETENYFDDEFDRELDDYDDPVRVNRLNLSRYWPRYSFNFETRWYDNVPKRRWEEYDPTLQYLPFVSFDATKQPIAKSPLYWDLDSEYIYFFRLDGRRSERGTTGHRLDVHPRVYWPYRFRNFFTFEPSAGFRQTTWYVDNYEDGFALEDRAFYRGLFDLKLDLSSEVFNIYPAAWTNLENIKHTIRPRLEYEYIPDRDQDELPFFNSLDRIAEQNLITFSLINTLTSKKRGRQTKGEPAAPLFNYRDVLRFKLEESYDFNRNQIYLVEKHGRIETEREHLSPLLAELDIRPARYLRLDTQSEISPYDGDILSNSVELKLFDLRGDELSVEHIYRRFDNESIAGTAMLRLFGGFSLYADSEYNIADDEKIENQVGLLYEGQCWSFDVSFLDEPDDDKIEVYIELYGLGGFGF